MKSLLIALLFVSAQAFAQHGKGVCDFPKNNLYVPDLLEDRTSRLGFEEAIKKAQALYAPIVAKRGAILEINDLWDDGTVNSQAYRTGNYWEVDMFGGLARYGRMDKYATAAVACHELGHHLGGRPRYDLNTDWASVEGQADRWALLGCIQKIYPGHALAAAMTLARTLASLGGEPLPHFNTPDPTRVYWIMEGHPPAQCRLDTMYLAYQGLGRPACWYPSGVHP